MQVHLGGDPTRYEVEKHEKLCVQHLGDVPCHAGQKNPPTGSREPG